MDRIRSITVFCGSSDGRDKAYREAAAKLGKAMADMDIALVYGGGSRGLMGIIAETVHDAGGHVTGVLPESMNTSAVRQKSVESEIIIVPSMHERKKTMYAMGDAYIAMPGGIGTMEELCEIYTWRQLRYHIGGCEEHHHCGRGSGKANRPPREREQPSPTEILI